MLLKFSVGDCWIVHPLIICVTGFLHLNPWSEGYLTKMFCIEGSRLVNFLLISGWLVYKIGGFPGGAKGKEPACQCRRRKRCGFNPWVRMIPWREGKATHSSILAWRIPWTEDPGELQSIGSQRVGHNWSDLAQFIWSAFTKIYS